MTSVKSSPTTSSTKPGQARGGGVANFTDPVFVQLFDVDEDDENMHVDEDDLDVFIVRFGLSDSG